MVCVVDFPPSLTGNSSVKFVGSLFQLPEEGEYIFDLKNLRWIDPFAMLFVSEALRIFCRDKASKGVKCGVRNFSNQGYCGHMGFFQSFGLDFGNRPGEAGGGTNYLPITEIRIHELYRRAVDSGQNVGEIITEDARTIATVLTRESEGALFDTVVYSLREIIRNAAEHSKSETVKYCAQYWPTKNRVQIAILDSGIGVASSLRNNPYLHIESDADALKLATMPGVSGKMYKGVEVRPYDEWQNSGYGLYMIYRMSRSAGSLFMTSNNATLEVISDTHKAASQNSLPGTSLRVQFDTRKIGILKEKLSKYAEEGKKKAEKILGTKEITASSASLMLHSEEE